MEKKGDNPPTKWSSPNEPASAENSSALRKPGLIVPIKYDEVAFQHRSLLFLPLPPSSPPTIFLQGELLTALPSKISLSLHTEAWRLIGAKKPK